MKLIARAPFGGVRRLPTGASPQALNFRVAIRQLVYQTEAAVTCASDRRRISVGRLAGAFFRAVTRIAPLGDI
jgi:hypothetical protein